MKVLVCGGGTGGHVMPALAVAGELKQRGADILFVGSTQPSERELVEQAGFAFRTISAGKLRRYISWRNLTDPWRVWQGYRQSRRLLAAFQPDVVFAKGGFVTVPMVKAAARAGIPVVIHESDVVAGLANRLAAKQAAAVATAWPVGPSSGLPEDKVHVVGTPLRREVLTGKADRAKRAFSLNLREPVVLVLGGSQGAVTVNRLVYSALPDLLTECQVVHQIGREAVSTVDAAVAGLPPQLHRRYHPKGFFGSELFDLYAAADLVVSRSGAGALAEIAATGKPSILIPLPSAAGNHQLHNAAAFAEAGAAVVLPQDELTATELTRRIKALLHDSQRRSAMGRAARRLATLDASRKLADLVWRTGTRDDQR